MKIKLQATILCMAFLASAAASAGQPGEINPGSTTATVHASDVSGFLQCAARAVDRDEAFGDANASSGAARAQALAKALTKLRLVTGGLVEVALTRHGHNGAVHQMQLDAAARNMRLAMLVSRSSVATDVEADAEAISEALAIAATADAYAHIDEKAEICFPFIGCTPGVTIFAADASAYGYASSVGFGMATAGTETGGEGSASAEAKIQSVGKSSSSVYVQGANIEEFEAEVTASEASLLKVNTGAIEQALLNAYALANASTDLYAEASAGAYVFKFGLGDDGETASDSESAGSDGGNSVYTTVQADAAAIAGMLAESRLRVTLKASFENLPGIDDKFEAFADAQASLDCSEWARATAEADASASTTPLP